MSRLMGDWSGTDLLPSLRSAGSSDVSRLVHASAVGLLLGGIGLHAPAVARPVICTTSLEAPSQSPASLPAAPVEVTRCGPVESTEAMVTRRFYTWTAPFARGVDVMHQVTDLLGIAVAGPEGNRVMGFGFPDQTVVWDGSALENTSAVLMEQQSQPIPWRTVDVSSGFDSSLAGGAIPVSESQPVMKPRSPNNDSTGTPVRGLW